MLFFAPNSLTRYALIAHRFAQFYTNILLDDRKCHPGGYLYAMLVYRDLRTLSIKDFEHKKRLPRVGSLLTCLVGVPRFELGTLRTRTVYLSYTRLGYKQLPYELRSLSEDNRSFVRNSVMQTQFCYPTGSTIAQ